MKYITIVFLLVPTVGCKSTTNVWTNDFDIREPIKILVLVDKDKIEVDVKRQDSSVVAGQYGLVGSLVGKWTDNYVTNMKIKSFEKQLSQFDSMFSNIGFKKMIGDSLEASLAKASNPFNKSAIHIIDDLAEVDGFVGEGENFMILEPAYIISQDFRYTFINIDTKILSNKGSKSKMLHRTNIFSIATKLPYSEGEGESLVKAHINNWLSKDANSIEEGFKRASRESGEILTKHLARTNIAIEPSYLKNIFP